MRVFIMKFLPKVSLAAALTFSLLIPTTGAFASENSDAEFLKQMEQEGQQAAQDIKVLKNETIDQDQLQIELNELKKENPEKYNQITGNMKLLATSGAMGTIGDILVSYDSGILGWNYGHAALVRKNSSYIVEAMPSTGVRSYKNNWSTRYTTKKKMYVKGAPQSAYEYAVSWADGKMGRPYSLVATKNTTSKYYCSLLVWQSWDRAGYDLDGDGGVAVFPSDLEKSYKTVVY